MKFVIEFDDNDIGEFIEEFGDDIKDHIRKRIKDALTEEERKSNSDDVPTVHVHKKMFNSKEEAENVLLDMQIILDKFNDVTIHDYYDLVGLQTLPDDDYYGWTDLKGIHVKPIYNMHMEGIRWTIELPRPVRLHRYDQVE